MKKGLWLVLVLLLALSVGAFAFQNEPEGFRGLKWGDPPGEDMVFKFEDSQLSHAYTRPTDKLSIGDAKFTYIDYSFYTPSEGDGQLYGVYLAFDKIQNYLLLNAICKKRFGQPTEQMSAEKPFMSRWKSEASAVFLDYNAEKRTGTLRMLCTPLFYERVKDYLYLEGESAESDW